MMLWMHWVRNLVVRIDNFTLFLLLFFHLSLNERQFIRIHNHAHALDMLIYNIKRQYPCSLFLCLF